MLLIQVISVPKLNEQFIQFAVERIINFLNSFVDFIDIGLAQ